jgi:hypothetical protein
MRALVAKHPFTRVPSSAARCKLNISSQLTISMDVCGYKILVEKFSSHSFGCSSDETLGLHMLRIRFMLALAAQFA